MNKSRKGKKNPNYQNGRTPQPIFSFKFDPGLRESVEALGVKNLTQFINEAVLEKVERKTAAKQK